MPLLTIYIYLKHRTPFYRNLNDLEPTGEVDFLSVPFETKFELFDRKFYKIIYDNKEVFIPTEYIDKISAVRPLKYNAYENRN